MRPTPPHSRSIARVTRLFRYPVKSMGGEACAALRFDARGVVGDRWFALKTDDGGLGSGKDTTRFRRVDGLLEFEATGSGEETQVRFPGGECLSVRDPRLGERLSEDLGRRVRVVPEGGVPHFDDGAVHFVFEEDLATTGAGLGQGPVDVRRVRPNLVLETGDSSAPVQARTGSLIAVGPEVRLRLEGPTVRCRMVGVAQRDLEADPQLEASLAGNASGCFGFYASVRRGGEVREGDSVVLL